MSDRDKLLENFVCALGGAGMAVLTDAEDGATVECNDGVMTIVIAESDWYAIEVGLMAASRFAAERDEGERGATWTTAMDLPGDDAMTAARRYVAQFGDKAEDSSGQTGPDADVRAAPQGDGLTGHADVEVTGG